MCKVKGIALLETIYALSIISISIVIGINVFNSVLTKKSILRSFEIHQQIIFSLNENKKNNFEHIIINKIDKNNERVKIKEVIYKGDRETKTYTLIEKK